MSTDPLRSNGSFSWSAGSLLLEETGYKNQLLDTGVLSDEICLMINSLAGGSWDTHQLGKIWQQTTFIAGIEIETFLIY